MAAAQDQRSYTTLAVIDGDARGMRSSDYAVVLRAVDRFTRGFGKPARRGLRRAASARQRCPERVGLLLVVGVRGGGRRVCHGAGESGWRILPSGHCQDRRPLVVPQALSCGFAVRIFEDRIPLALGQDDGLHC